MCLLCVVRSYATQDDVNKDYVLLGCGSFVRGRKRKEGWLKTFYINEEITRGVNDVRDKPGEASQYISINYPVSQSYIYQTPLVHDSPASKTQSSNEDLIPQTAPLLGTRCYLRNSSGIAR